MKTEILRPASTEDFARAAALIRDGQLVAFPTETVYGLGANGLDAAACARIYEAKGRPSDNPLILHIADLSMLDEAAEEVPPAAAHLLTAFAPGPITVIVPKAAHIPPLVTGGLSTVGVRCPAHDVARRLIRAAGVPIAAPSANISGRPSPTTAAMTAADMTGRIPLILDGGSCSWGVESTIVDCTEEGCVTILRPGAVTPEMISAELPHLTVRMDAALVSADTAPRAPGMKYTHYAPRVPLTVSAGMGDAARAAYGLCGSRDGCRRGTEDRDRTPYGGRRAACTDREQRYHHGTQWPPACGVYLQLRRARQSERSCRLPLRCTAPF